MIGPALGRMLCPWLAAALEQLEAAAKADRLGHAWLISGPAGTGKRNLAYVLADRLLTARIGAAPPAAAKAREVLTAEADLANADLHPDLHRIRAEEDKRTIAVQQIRDATGALALKPHLAACKLVIIEGADTMTTEAANALLKSLEEPTPSTYLLLLAERPGRLPPTILSRCQRLALRPPPADDVDRWLRADGLDPSNLARAPQRLAPLIVARLLEDDSLSNIYNKINNSIDLFYESGSGLAALADSWQKADTDLALGCLIERLQAAIRGRLVPGHSKPVTDASGNLTENRSDRIDTGALFAGVRMAENLREQLGRGVNVELALKSLLLGLEQNRSERVIS